MVRFRLFGCPTLDDQVAMLGMGYGYQVFGSKLWGKLRVVSTKSLDVFF